MRIPAGATVITDFNPGEVLRYAAVVENSLQLKLVPAVDDVHHLGGDVVSRMVEIVRRELDESGRDVYLADSYEPYYHLTRLHDHFDLSRVGPFVRVSHRGAENGAARSEPPGSASP